MASLVSLLSPLAGNARLVLEAEPNSSFAAAQAVDGHFTLDFDRDIGNGTLVDNTSLSMPHVSVRGTGDGSFDYFRFTFSGPGTSFGFVVLDIDHSPSSFDSRVALWSADGSLLGHNDDYDYRGGADGSVARYSGTMSYDALMTTYLVAPGTYVVGVARFGASPVKDGFTGGSVDAEPQPGDFYTLQISVENMPVVPEPATWALLGMGLVAMLGRVRACRRRVGA